MDAQVISERSDAVLRAATPADAADRFAIGQMMR
jgi:hypothetical protein